MKSKSKKIVLVLISTLVVAGLSVTLMPKRSKAEAQTIGYTYSKVTLYSAEGNVLGTWTATGLGRMDGNSFTFDLYEGIATANPKQVRISGTFTVEQTAP